MRWPPGSEPARRRSAGCAPPRARSPVSIMASCTVRRHEPRGHLPRTGLPRRRPTAQRPRLAWVRVHHRCRRGHRAGNGVRASAARRRDTVGASRPSTRTAGLRWPTTSAAPGNGSHTGHLGRHRPRAEMSKLGRRIRPQANGANRLDRDARSTTRHPDISGRFEEVDVAVVPPQRSTSTAKGNGQRPVRGILTCAPRRLAVASSTSRRPPPSTGQPSELRHFRQSPTKFFVRGLTEAPSTSNGSGAGHPRFIDTWPLFSPAPRLTDDMQYRHHRFCRINLSAQDVADAIVAKAVDISGLVAQGGQQAGSRQAGQVRTFPARSTARTAEVCPGSPSAAESPDQQATVLVSVARWLLLRVPCST